MTALDLSVLPGTLAIVRLPGNVPAPNWALAGDGFLCVTRIEGELSVVAPSDVVPERVPGDDGWRAIRVRGPLDLAMTGVLASLATPLAEAEIPIFAVSTHDTDHLLVKEDSLDAARAALTAAGHRFAPEPGEG